MTSLISCRDVCKRFYEDTHRATSMQEIFIRSVLRRRHNGARARFQLTQFNLEVGRGDAVALIGANGSGKSTALRLMAGVYVPTSGALERHGRVAALIELGATFHPELTGIENVRLYAAALGLSRREIKSRQSAMLDIAALGDYAGVPTKYFSSGMQVRLAFAVAISAEPDVLIVDELLSVGDELFMRQSLERIAAFRARGGALILVSHDTRLLRDVCAHAVWLDAGHERMQGPCDAVVDAYRDAQKDASAANGQVFSS